MDKIAAVLETPYLIALAVIGVVVIPIAVVLFSVGKIIQSMSKKNSDKNS